MNCFQYINSNINLTKRNVGMGLFPCSILRHYEIYSRYDSFIKMGHNCHEAFHYILYDYNISERSLYRIIKEMEKEL